MGDTALIRLSKQAISHATELGREMASDDQVLKPDLRRAHCYEDYRRFRNAHREQWERTEAFIRVWQDQLFTLAQNEGERFGLRMDDSMVSWDIWYDKIVVPMKNVMWDTCEHIWDLAALYTQANPTRTVVETVPSGPLDLIYRYLTLMSRSDAPVADEVDAAIWQ